MEERNLVKAKFILTATEVEEVKQDDGTTALKVVRTTSDQMSGREFKRSMYDDRLNGIEHKIELVNKKPEEFQLNTLYILLDGTRMWVWVKKDSEPESLDCAVARPESEEKE